MRENELLWKQTDWTAAKERVLRLQVTKKWKPIYVPVESSCDSKRAKNVALSLLPIIGWMKIYRIKEWLPGDVVSGISTGLVAIMQGGEMDGENLNADQSNHLIQKWKNDLPLEWPTRKKKILIQSFIFIYLVIGTHPDLHSYCTVSSWHFQHCDKNMTGHYKTDIVTPGGTKTIHGLSTLDSTLSCG